ncbi:MAG: IS66 family transposase [Lachnospiraceae bacterium]|nr:IS66 family transposase [Lachnospiraceae bacterium]
MNVRIISKNEQSLAQENVALRKKVTTLEEQLALLQEQFDWLKKQVFGRKTEQTSVIMDGGTQLSLFPDEKEQAVSEPEKVVTVPEYQRKAKRTHDEWMKNLPVEEIVHIEENPICDICGSPMTVIGKEKLYDEVVYQPAQIFVRRHYVEKYMCTDCVQESENKADSYANERCYIRCAPHPQPMIPHSFCSPELTAHITYEKFAKAVPLYRQEKDFAAKGIPLLRATMSDWVCTIAERWCLPILQKMHELLLAGNVIHADETVFQVLHETDRKATTDSRMWVYCNGKMNDRSSIIFEYQPTRAGVHPAKFLKGFTGFLICDGYDAYNAVTGTKRCGCWTHTRRHFVEALPKDKSAYSTSVAAKAVSFCDSIYHEEKLLADMTATERYEQRLVKVKPLLDAFFSWLEEQNVSGKGKLAKAVRYALNEKKYLYTFLEDGNIPIDNNRAENAIRPFAVGRKNWLFNNTERGAKCSAILYSIISTALANGLDAEKYLTELFSQPPGTILLPWKE